MRFLLLELHIVFCFSGKFTLKIFIQTINQIFRILLLANNTLVFLLLILDVSGSEFIGLLSIFSVRQEACGTGFILGKQIVVSNFYCIFCGHSVDIIRP